MSRGRPTVNARWCVTADVELAWVPLAADVWVGLPFVIEDRALLAFAKELLVRWQLSESARRSSTRFECSQQVLATALGTHPSRIRTWTAALIHAQLLGVSEGRRRGLVFDVEPMLKRVGLRPKQAETSTPPKTGGVAVESGHDSARNGRTSPPETGGHSAQNRRSQAPLERESKERIPYPLSSVEVALRGAAQARAILFDPEDERRKRLAGEAKKGTT